MDSFDETGLDNMDTHKLTDESAEREYEAAQREYMEAHELADNSIEKGGQLQEVSHPVDSDKRAMLFEGNFRDENGTAYADKYADLADMINDMTQGMSIVETAQFVIDHKIQYDGQEIAAGKETDAFEEIWADINGNEMRSVDEVVEKMDTRIGRCRREAAEYAQKKDAAAFQAVNEEKEVYEQISCGIQGLSYWDPSTGERAETEIWKKALAKGQEMENIAVICDTPSMTGNATVINSSEKAIEDKEANHKKALPHVGDRVTAHADDAGKHQLTGKVDSIREKGGRDVVVLDCGGKKVPLFADKVRFEPAKERARERSGSKSKGFER